VCAIAILALGWRWGFDDPYITYRYADNLAAGRGFVYNPGEAVLSTTAPGFALLLSPCAALGFDLALVARVIGALALGACVPLLVALGRPGAALVLPAFGPITATLGGEMPLLLAFALGMFAAARRTRWALAGVLCSLAILIRLDGLLLLPFLGGMLYRARAVQLDVAHTGAVLSALLLPALALSMVYFGGPIPVTLAAKQAQGSMTLSHTLFEALPDIIRWHAWQPVYALIAVLAGAGLIAQIRSRSGWTVVAFGVLHVLVYVALGVAGYFWYVAPVALSMVWLAGAGLESLVARLPIHRTRTMFGLSAATGLLLFGHWFALNQRPQHRLTQLSAINTWLRTHTSPDQSVGALEIGVIGYRLPNRIVDFAGLIQPDLVAQIRPDTDYVVLTRAAIQTNRPDWVVAYAGGFAAAAEEAGCRARQSFNGGGDQPAATIYRCSPE
jgi:hypothetical protein